MDYEKFKESVSVELARFDEIRSGGQSNMDDKDVAKSMIGEFNAHVRRMDSLWRQFSDDHKRAVGAGIVPAMR